MPENHAPGHARRPYFELRSIFAIGSKTARKSDSWTCSPLLDANDSLSRMQCDNDLSKNLTIILSKVNEVYKMKVGAQTICLPCEEKVPEAERDNIQNKVKDFFARIKESETSTKLKNFFRY